MYVSVRSSCPRAQCAVPSGLVVLDGEFVGCGRATHRAHNRRTLGTTGVHTDLAVARGVEVREIAARLTDAFAAE